MKDIASAMGIDASGNSYVTGYFKSNTVIVGSTTLTNSGPPDGDVLLVKFDALGNAIWAKSKRFQQRYGISYCCRSIRQQLRYRIL